jgi:tetratricopeptide (TPR) repeat protein
MMHFSRLSVARCLMMLGVLVFLSLPACMLRTKSTEQSIEEVREELAKKAKVENEKTLKWENFIDSLYRAVDTSRISSLSAIDNLIASGVSLDRFKTSELHFIKGDIYYRIDSLKKAIDEYTLSGKDFSMTPKKLAARAGAYIKMKQYDSAFSDLNKAAEDNYDFYWNVGNYYEIIGNIDSAISYYNRLYYKDTIIYKFCHDRALELKNDKVKPLKELVYRNYGRVTVQWNVD